MPSGASRAPSNTSRFRWDRAHLSASSDRLIARRLPPYRPKKCANRTGNPPAGRTRSGAPQPTRIQLMTIGRQLGVGSCLLLSLSFAGVAGTVVVGRTGWFGLAQAQPPPREEEKKRREREKQKGAPPPAPKAAPPPPPKAAPPPPPPKAAHPQPPPPPRIR